MSDSGVAYWGRYSAAGLLLRAPRPDGTPRCCCSTARCGPSGRHLGLAEAVLRRTRRQNRRGHRIEREAGLSAGGAGCRPQWSPRVCGSTLTHLDLHHRCRRCRGVAGHRAQPGKRRTALGGRERGGRLPFIGFAASWQRLPDRSGDRATGPVRRTAAAALPRTIQIEAGVFLWCTPGDADRALAAG